MQISTEQFEAWIGEAIDSLPEKFAEKVYNAAFLAADEPSAEQRKKSGLGKDTLLLGLYEGHHQSARRNVGPVLPDRITLFRKSFAQLYTSEEEAKKQIKKTIIHEIAHHFGFDEAGAVAVAKTAQENK